MTPLTERQIKAVYAYLVTGTKEAAAERALESDRSLRRLLDEAVVKLEASGVRDLSRAMIEHGYLKIELIPQEVPA